MEKASLLQSFALDKDLRVRSVDEVARGLACECTCPACAEKVIARQGDIREWHFAHASGAECGKAVETALHLAAKQLLLESGGMTLPATTVQQEIILPDGRRAIGTAHRPEIWVDFDTVALEKPIGDIKPDVVATLNGAMFFIEVAVTHFVDETKRLAIEKLGIPTVEICLEHLGREKVDWEMLTELVIQGATCKSWVHILGMEALVVTAREEAYRAAFAQELVPSIPNPTRTSRTRFRVGGRIVDVIERPFGLAIWSPYDPIVNGWIKEIIRPLGGRWQRMFKNWLVPLEAKDCLFQELLKLSDGPPELK